MTSLMGLLLHSSPHQRTELARRWGIGVTGSGLSVSILYHRMTDVLTLRSLVATLPSDQLLLLQSLCTKRDGVVALDKAAASFGHKPSLMASDVNALRGLALITLDRDTRTIRVVADNLAPLRDLFAQTSPRAVCQHYPASRPQALIAIASPASVKLADLLLFSHMAHLDTRGRRLASTSPSDSQTAPRPYGAPSCGRETGASKQLAASAKRLAVECASGLGLLLGEIRTEHAEDALAAWKRLNQRQQVIAALEVWLSNRKSETRTQPTTNAVMRRFRARQYVRRFMADAAVDEWYSLEGALKRELTDRISRRFASANKARKETVRTIVEAVVIDMHSFGCLDIGFDSAGKVQAVRMTSLGSALCKSSGRALQRDIGNAG